MPLIKHFLLKTDDDARALNDCLRLHRKDFALQGKPLHVVVQDKPPKRTTKQNAYLHAILNTISDAAWVEGQQYELLEWKEYFGLKFLPLEDIKLPGGLKTQSRVSTTTLTVREFEHFMEQIFNYCFTILNLPADLFEVY